MNISINQSSKKAIDFDTLVVTELQMLRTGERRLQRLYSDLQKKPQLRPHFMRELAELRLRADRLDAVLNPAAAYDSPAVA